MHIAIVGAGWAGLAAALRASERGHAVTLYDMAPQPGGRARRVDIPSTDGAMLPLDNGQHILIGAYRETLDLMASVGVKLADVLQRVPLDLTYADGTGLATPLWAASWPAPSNALAAMLCARGWRPRDRMALANRSIRWQLQRFRCAPDATVSSLCEGLPERVMEELIEPLCVSALNLGPESASGAVFLRVMQDALFGKGSHGFAASDMLLPKADLGTLLPERAVAQLRSRNADVRVGHRVTGIVRQSGKRGWTIISRNGSADDLSDFDAVIWATTAPEAARAMHQLAKTLPEQHKHRVGSWASIAERLHHTAIGTVYVKTSGRRLPRPMVALRVSRKPEATPIQFAFDRGQLQSDVKGMDGVIALVASDCRLERDALIDRAVAQAASTLDLGPIKVLGAIIEKRATFACLAGLKRPAAEIAPHLFAAGDYVDGPYPATLEAAVRSGNTAVALCDKVR